MSARLLESGEANPNNEVSGRESNSRVGRFSMVYLNHSRCSCSYIYCRETTQCLVSFPDGHVSDQVWNETTQSVPRSLLHSWRLGKSKPKVWRKYMASQLQQMVHHGRVWMALYTGRGSTSGGLATGIWHGRYESIRLSEDVLYSRWIMTGIRHGQQRCK